MTDRRPYVSLREREDYIEQLRQLKAETESVIETLLRSIGGVMLWLAPTSPEQWSAIYKTLEGMTAQELEEWTADNHPSRLEFFRRYQIGRVP